MKELDAKITAGLGIIMFLCVLWIKGPELSFDTITTAVSLTVLLRWAFIRCIWKWLPFLERLHGVPNVTGHWKGKFESTFELSPGIPASNEIDVKITQPDIFRVKVTQKSGESVSHSYGEQIETLEDGSLFLNFSYKNIPDATVRAASQISFGSARYELERGKKTILKGNYWTDRKSTGKITLLQKK